MMIEIPKSEADQTTWKKIQSYNTAPFKALSPEASQNINL